MKNKICWGILLGLTLFGLFSLRLAADEKTIGPATPAATITPTAESQTEFWYNITYNDDKFGHLQETWESVNYPNPAGLVWKITTKVVLNRTELPLPLRKGNRVTYLTKDNLAFLEGNVSDVQMRRESKQVVFVYAQPTGQIKVPAPAEEIYSDWWAGMGRWLVQQPDILNKKFQLKILYEPKNDKDARVNPFVNVTLKVTGSKVKEQIMNQPIEGYLVEYHSDAAEWLNDFEMFVASGGEVLKLTAGSMVIVRVGSKDEAQVKPERKVFEKGDRVDPFIPAYKRGWKPPVIGGFEPKGDELTDAKALKLVQQAQELLEKMRKMDPEKDDKELLEAYLAIRNIREQINQTKFKELQQRMDDVISAAEGIFPAAKRTAKRAERLRDEAAQKFARIKSDGRNVAKEEFESLDKMTQELADLCLRQEISGTEYEQPMKDWANEVKGWNRQAGIIREFFTTHNDSITGFISYDEPKDIVLEPPLRIKLFGLPLNEVLGIRYNHRRAEVAINGQFYQENDKITPDLSVKSIIENKQVTFEYKGVDITVKKNEGGKK